MSGEYVCPSLTAGESLRRSVTSLKEVLVVREPRRHGSALSPLSWCLRRRLVSPGMRFSAPARHLPPRSSHPQSSSLTSHLSPGALHLTSVSCPCPVSSICLLPAASGFLCPGCIPVSPLMLSSDRPVVQHGRVQVFVLLILSREQECTCAPMNYFLKTYCN